MTEQVFPKSVLDCDQEMLELYKETDNLLKETKDILEKVATALDKKKVYSYDFNSTENCEINHNAIALTTESYKI
ncbi:MAG: hypothetical protein GDA46_04275 [Bdellovibrionales bacterium]|nr:hypothetical protein [Bdellovibrionales bacterium]